MSRPPRLTEAQVRAIIAARDASPRPSPEALAAEHGVSRHTIYDLWRGRTWRHIPREAGLRRPTIERLAEAIAKKLDERSL